MFTRLLKWLISLSIIGFILLNVALYNHAWQMTHYALPTQPKNSIRKPQPDKMSMKQKLYHGFWGIERPKPGNWLTPADPYQVFNYGKTPRLHAWYYPSPSPSPKGIFIIFHGYNSCKAQMLGRAEALRMMGYHTFLPDFRAHGDSEGDETTIGVKESEDVINTFKYIRSYYPDQKIYLLGVSMGAAAVAKAISETQLNVEKVILESPYSTLKSAVSTRIQDMGVPATGLTELLLFWGSFINSMDAFKQDIGRFAQDIQAPVLLLRGAKDNRVSEKDINHIFKALPGIKERKTLPEATHNTTFADHPTAWKKAVATFLSN